jgi:Ca2+-binding EF-hand superfamily protein
LEIEIRRQTIVQECEDFNTIDAFRFFDREGRGEINFETLQGILLSEIFKFAGRRAMLLTD